MRQTAKEKNIIKWEEIKNLVEVSELHNLTLRSAVDEIIEILF